MARVSYTKLQRRIADEHPMAVGLLCIDIDLTGSVRLTDYGPITEEEKELAFRFVKQLAALRFKRSKQFERRMPKDLKRAIKEEQG